MTPDRRSQILYRPLGFLDAQDERVVDRADKKDGQEARKERYTINKEMTGKDAVNGEGWKGENTVT